MEGLSLSIATTSSPSGNAYGFRLRVASFSNFRHQRNNISLLQWKPRNKLLVFAAPSSDKNVSELRKYVSMELELGKLVGEDPEFTLAKIVGRRSYPGMTDMDLYKIYKKHGKAAFPELDQLPFDLSEIKKKPVVRKKKATGDTLKVPGDVVEINGVKLVRPVPKKSFEYELDYRPRTLKKRTQPVVKIVDTPVYTGPSITLRKPNSSNDVNIKIDKPVPSEERNLPLKVPERQIKERPNYSNLVRKPDAYSKNKEETSQEVQIVKAVDKSLNIGPSINLRKPTNFVDDNIEMGKPLGLSEEWNLSLGIPDRQSNERLNDSELIRKPNPSVLENRKETSQEAQAITKTVDESPKSDPSITLRKPANFYDDEIKTDKSLALSEEWSLSLEISERQRTEEVIDSKLVRKPDSYILENMEEASREAQALGKNDIEDNTCISLLQKPDILNLDINNDQKLEYSAKGIPINNSIKSGSSTIASLLQKPEIGDPDLHADPKQDSGGQRQSNSGISMETVNELNINLDQSIESWNVTLQEQPRRLDPSSKQRFTKSSQGGSLVNPGNSPNAFENDNFSAKPPIKENEDRDWKRAEDLIKAGDREEVELISVNTVGFAVSFGSLVGFLPYRNVANRWRYLPFESWLRKKGLDPSNYKQNIGIVGKYEATYVQSSFDSSVNSKAASELKIGCEISPDMKLDDLLVIYGQEKLKYSSSFVGQKFKLYVILADRESRKLIFSSKQKEKEESIERKKRLMAKLSVGDVVKCCITKITYFGIFVEVEGVPALIHQSEVSWADTLDISAHFKSGQVIEAKVIQLDFSLGRILLSLKELMPDPLIEALESALIDHASLEAVQADMEWTDVDSLVKELEQYEGIQSVSKGRYFLSPGLAPTFQVYMASMFEDQYKLLARSENRVKEVLVKSSLNKEEMKIAILICTKRVK